MLRIITGLAGTGKTSQILSEIASAVAEGRGGNMLLVPEQYSHEAERELCARCGDGMSLYAEVFSFTGLARRVTSRVGGAAGERLDAELTRSAEKIQHAPALYVELADIEDRLLHRVGGGADGVALGLLQFSSSGASGDDAHGASSSSWK